MRLKVNVHEVKINQIVSGANPVMELCLTNVSHNRIPTDEWLS